MKITPQTKIEVRQERIQIWRERIEKYSHNKNMVDFCKLNISLLLKEIEKIKSLINE